MQGKYFAVVEMVCLLPLGGYCLIWNILNSFVSVSKITSFLKLWA